MPRLFAALEISHDTATALSLLRGGLSGARWIDAENYHLTLRFFGDVEGHTADEIAHALDHVRVAPFRLGFDGLGVFGGKKPRNLHAVPDASPELADLNAAIERQAKRLGLKADARKFAPHVTLARLRNTPPAAVANYISIRGGFFALPSDVTRFVLMSSRDSTGGGPYITEEIYPLRAESRTHAVSSAQHETMATPIAAWR